MLSTIFASSVILSCVMGKSHGRNCEVFMSSLVSRSSRLGGFWLVGLIAICGVATTAIASASSEHKPKSYASPLDYGLDIKYQASRYPNLVWANSAKSGSSGYGAVISFEWLPLGDLYGKIVLGFNFSATYLSRAILDDGETGKLMAFPVGPYLGYRLDLIKNQVLVPFVKYGFTVANTHQVPEATGQSRTAYYYGLDWTLGVEFCLNSLEPSAGNTFDATMGINGTYLVAEVVLSSNLNATKHPDLSGNQIQGGFRFEF